MANQVIWTSKALETFIREANLNEEEEWIMRTRVKGWSRTRQAAELHISLSCLDKRIKKLKKLYDHVQKDFPDVLPVRKMSSEELWMDNN